MSKDEKKVQTFYIKVANQKMLKEKAFAESTAYDPISDDMILDEMLDSIRIHGQYPAPTRKAQKKTGDAVINTVVA